MAPQGALRMPADTARHPHGERGLAIPSASVATWHPAGRTDSAFLASRRRMLRTGTIVVAGSQGLIVAWSLIEPRVERRGALLAGAGIGLAATAVHALVGFRRVRHNAVTAWMLLLAVTTGLVGWGSPRVAGPAALQALPAALVAAVVLPPGRFAVVSAAHQGALVVPVLLSRDGMSTLWVRLGVHAIT